MPNFADREVASVGLLTGVDLASSGNWISRWGAYYFIVNGAEQIPGDSLNILGNIITATWTIHNYGAFSNRRVQARMYANGLLINDMSIIAAFIPAFQAGHVWWGLRRQGSTLSVSLRSWNGSVFAQLGMTPIPNVNANTLMQQASQTVNIDTPPHRRWTCWDTFIAEGYDPTLGLDREAIQNLITGTGSVEVLVPPLTGTGTTAVQTPDGQNRHWNDAVAAPGTWTRPGVELPVNVWDLENLRQEFPDSRVEQLGDGTVRVTMPDGTVIDFIPGRPFPEIVVPPQASGGSRSGTRNIVT